MTSSPKDRKKDRDHFIEAVRTQLLPTLLQNGFSVAPLVTDRGPVDRELAASLPLGRLRRRREDAIGVDLVEIALARHRNAFRLSVGVAPAKGVRTFTGLWPAEDVLVGWLDEFFEMYASPTWRRWFSVRRWPWQAAPSQEDHEQLAREVSSLLPELEAALRQGRVGPHAARGAGPSGPRARGERRVTDLYARETIQERAHQRLANSV